MITLFLMGEKGFRVLESFCSHVGTSKLDCVVSDTDSGLQHDFFNEIESYCRVNGIRFLTRLQARDLTWSYAFTIGWRRIIENDKNLIVLHDSLLPSYRGFAPLVTALLNGEEEVGVTAIFASERYDEGDVIAYRKLAVPQLTKIGQVIEWIIPLYCELVNQISLDLIDGRALAQSPQDHSLATYSLWRDQEDYSIDWTWSVVDIERFVKSVGQPYAGASARLNGKLVRVFDCKRYCDQAVIENTRAADCARTYGKVFRIEDGHPIVFCKDGLLEITELVDSTGWSLLPFGKLKSKFK